jgi:hypothetical protein
MLVFSKNLNVRGEGKSRQSEVGRAERSQVLAGGPDTCSCMFKSPANLDLTHAPSELPHHGSPEAADDVIVDHADRLHERIADGRPYEFHFTRQAGILSYGIGGGWNDIHDIRVHGRDERHEIGDFYSCVEFTYGLMKESQAK